MTKEQKKWADLIIKGIDEVSAYLKVYPKASKKTATNQLGKFRHDSVIQTYINSKAHKIAQKVEVKTLQSIEITDMGEILTVAKKRWLLAKIANGTYEYERVEITKDGDIVKVMCKPNLMEMMKAIDIDNRMSGDNMTAKSNEQDLNKSKTILIIEDKTNEPNSNK